MGVKNRVLSFPENEFVDPVVVQRVLKGDQSITMVAMVHCETSSGVFNPVVEVGQLVKLELPGSVSSFRSFWRFSYLGLTFLNSQRKNVKIGKKN